MGLGTSEVALTAHLVMPAGHPGDAFFSRWPDPGAALPHSSPTIQIEIDGIDDGCPAPHVPSCRVSGPCAAGQEAVQGGAEGLPVAWLKAAGPPVCTPLLRSSSRKFRIDRRSAMLAGVHLAPRVEGVGPRSRTAAARGCRR
jgi:hypothetical protein